MKTILHQNLCPSIGFLYQNFAYSIVLRLDALVDWFPSTKEEPFIELSEPEMLLSQFVYLKLVVQYYFADARY